jgi:hypothetical protein
MSIRNYDLNGLRRLELIAIDKGLVLIADAPFIALQLESLFLAKAILRPSKALVEVNPAPSLSPRQGLDLTCLCSCDLWRCLQPTPTAQAAHKPAKDLLERIRWLRRLAQPWVSRRRSQRGAGWKGRKRASTGTSLFKRCSLFVQVFELLSW